MKTRLLALPGIMFGTLCLAVALCAEPAEDEATSPTASKAPAADLQVEDDARVSVAVARDRAKTMHQIYAATLEVMHHRYFHRERSVVPARAMEDVFKEIRRQSKAEARWISVSLQAMSIDHNPETDFEKQAAREIAAGKDDIEGVENGFYRRAGAIPLTGGCVGCHGGLLKEQSKTPKFAGLIISIPVSGDSNQLK